MNQKKALGRGLGALIPQKAEQAAAAGLTHIPLDRISANPYQPRKIFNERSIDELARSVREHGIVQPLVVTRTSDNRYRLIAGERRFRAAQKAGLQSVPAVIKDLKHEGDALQIALIENIQREDLNPMEEAITLSRLQQEFSLTHQQIADAVGKSRATVTNLLRLMALRDDVQRMLEHGDIEMGHARALLSLTPEMQSSTAHTVVGKGLSVRQTESLVRKLLEEKDKPQNPDKPVGADADIKRLEESLAEKIGAPVQIQHTVKGKGKLVLTYNSLDELDGILSHIR